LAGVRAGARFSSARQFGLKAKKRGSLSRRKAMEWLSGKTSMAGTQISNWVLVITALAAIWIIYSVVAH
jgi:hypothetical protein